MAKEGPPSCSTQGTQFTIKHILTEYRQYETLLSEKKYTRPTTRNPRI